MPNVRSTRYYEDFSAQQTMATTTAGETPPIADENRPVANATDATEQPSSSPIKKMQEPITPEPANPGGALSFASSEDTFAPENSRGEILVQATTSRGTRPVTEAAVIITTNKNGNKEIVAETFTNKDGRTNNIFVPAPSGSDSLTPTDTLPFADYDISVTHPLYYTAEIKNVQVFGGQLTIQVAELIPLPEYINENNITQTVDIPKQNL